MIKPAAVIVAVTALTIAARSFAPEGVTTASGAALALGFLLLVALPVGQIFHALKLPHLTGFICCGVLFGPEVLGVVTPRMISDLALGKGVAVGLIAIMAGCELNLRALAPKLRDIALFSLGSMAIMAALLWPVFFAVASLLPATRELTLAERATAALACANVFCAFSPSVVVGIVSETRARGPLAELCVAIVVLADLVIVVSFALTSSLAHAVFPSGAAHAQTVALVMHIFGSIAVGLVLGAGLTVYVQRVGRRVGLFVFGVLFLVAEAGRALHLDPLLVGLAAGLFVENVSPVSGAQVIHELERAALPTFAVFFAVVGAEVHLHEFLRVAPFAVLVALTRAFGIRTGTRWAARYAATPAPVAKLVPFGLLPQAGVAIALASLLKRDFGTWGETLGTLILGAIVINELIGPVLFRMALVRAGEVPHEAPQGAGVGAIAREEPG